MNIIKRDGTTQEFNKDKIAEAIRKVFYAVGSQVGGIDKKIAKRIYDFYNNSNQDALVEDVQDMVEDDLLEMGFIKEAKAYIKYRQERTKVRQEGWKMDDLQFAIWNNKYRHNEESFDEWLVRVSGGNSEVAKLIRDKKFLFGGRILANRGLQHKGKKVTFSNCYVLPKPEDNLESIFNTARDMAKTYSMGGGVGISIGNLRPRGMEVNNTARTTSGAVSFMELYDLTTGLIGQAGRRGALMLSIPISHPDVEEFIDIKTKQGSVTKANISVQVTDEFMYAVINDTDYELRWEDSEGRKMTKTIRARELFDKNVKNNWDWAEAGFLFWDNINKQHIMSEYEDYEFAGTNPCFTGDMRLLTEDGYRTFKELASEYEVEVVNKNGATTNGYVWETGQKEVVEVSFNNRESIFCTPDHVFMTIDGTTHQAKDLKGKRLKPFFFNEGNHDELFVKLGFIQGDGNLSRLNSVSHKGIEINFGKNDQSVRAFFGDKSTKRAVYTTEFTDTLKELGFSQKVLPERLLPKTIGSWSHKQIVSFLRGLYSANGSVIRNNRVALKSTNLDLIKEVQQLLLELGIKSYITTNKKKNVEFENGAYLCKESYDLNIAKYKSILKFYKHIGFIQPYKEDFLEELLTVLSPKVKAVKSTGRVETVYDFNEPETNWGVVEGVVVSNCGEVPLVAGGTCLLGSINLSEFVTDPFTDKAKADLDGIEKAVRIAVRGLNEVLDEGEDLHPLQSQRDAVRDYRQIGLGVMGFADMLIKLGIKYGSSDCLALINTIGFIFSDRAVSESSRIAVDKGSFKKFDANRVLKSKYIAYATSDETKKEIRKNGLRNSQILAIAPTGTLSTLLGVSGGAEPIFATKFKRKTESVHNEDVYYDVYTPIVKEIIDRSGAIPDYVVTSHDVSWQERIAVQAYWQAFIDSAISSTVNLPNSTTPEEVGELFKTAWDSGLKGVTIFRDGCKRAGILTVDDPDNEKDEVAVVEQSSDKYQLCSECGEKIEVIQNGCTICMNCGHSPC